MAGMIASIIGLIFAVIGALSGLIGMFNNYFAPFMFFSSGCFFIAAISMSVCYYFYSRKK